MDSHYIVQDTLDSNQQDRRIKLFDNQDGTFSQATLNIPQGIPAGTKAFIVDGAEVSVGGGVLTPIVSIRNDSTDKNLRYGTASLATDGNKPVIFEIYKNATLVGDNFTPYGGASFSSYDTSATSLSGGELVGGVVLNKVDSARINLFTNDIFVKATPNDILTLVAKTSNQSEVTFFIRHLEEN